MYRCFHIRYHHKTLFSYKSSHTLSAISVLPSQPPPPPNFAFKNLNATPIDNAKPLDSYEDLVQRYRRSCSLFDAHQFHLEVLRRGVFPDLFVSNTLLNVYAKAGDLVAARYLFDEMPERNLVSWACLISGYSRNGMVEDAFGAFKLMISDGVLPSCFAFVGLLRACQGSNSKAFGVKLGLQLHGMSVKFPFYDDVLLGNVLISMYGNCLGYVEYARRVFNEIKVKNLISRNSVISIYTQRGDAVSAFELFSRMNREDAGFECKPNEYTFGSLISAACSSLCYLNLFLLEQVLARVEKCGLLPDLYVGSAFVSGFSRFGLFDRARKILGQMSEKNVVSMNGLMIGLVRQKRGEEATHVFMEMRKMVDINYDSYVVLLSALGEFNVLEEGRRKGREVHAHIICNGLFEVTVAIGNGLINMYSKCFTVTDAKRVFTMMDDKDSVTWNSMISGFDQNECFEEAVKSYHTMRTTGLLPSNFTLISTLSSCASLRRIKLGEQIHGEGLKIGLDFDVSVSNALLALYAETGYLDKCQNLFSLMPEYDQVSWNTLIGAFADSETSVSSSVEIFLDMMRAGWSPNRVTFINVMSAVSALASSKLNHEVHALVVKYNHINDGAIENALLTCYGKCREMDDCKKIFCRMSERDEVSWNSMIAGYIHNEDLNEAMNLVWFMMQRGQRLDSFTFATVLSACASIATLGRGMEVHACAVRASLESDVVIGSALVDMYSKCGRVDYASRFFSLMPVKNVYSWNSMISGYARHGHGEKALELFGQMKLKGQLPDHVTFVGVLSACSHVGLVEEGFEHFMSMTKEYCLTPRIEHYSCMVDLLGRAGKLNKIEKFIDAMPMEPNVLIWRTVLGACCRANGRKIELGKKAAEKLLDMEPENAVNYVLLSNMYASGENWEGMAKVRRAMRTAAVKKEVGCSWVTMKDGVHVFVAGDRSHPENVIIYDKLNEINRKIRDIGYVPQTKFSLYDLEQENREELLSYHSEKLAIAFVLTRSSQLPIRIMKNLRVCGDCHSFFKYVSEIVSRLIVLRDSNRFHHFQNGKCSCGDYW